MCEQSGNLEEDFTDLEDPDYESMNVGAFILVKISSKKTIKYFVAEIIAVHEDSFDVQDLKKKIRTLKSSPK